MAGFVFGLVTAVQSRSALAFAFHDGPAAVQRGLLWYEQLQQYRQVIGAANDHLAAFRQAVKGGMNWKNLGWLDTLQLLDGPWFDRVQGIDDIRAATTVAVMTAEQATKLWTDVTGFGKWRSSDRYRTDPWFRDKVDSVFNRSNRARSQRAAMLRMIQQQNVALIEDVKKIHRLRDAIEDETRKADAEKRAVNQTLIMSLQAEIAATEAKYQAESTILKNQQAIMFMVGDDDAYRSFVETTRSEWLDRNRDGMRAFGQGFAR
jgi:hypothetical protein